MAGVSATESLEDRGAKLRALATRYAGPDRVAAWQEVLATLGVECGDRILFCCDNTSDHVAVLFLLLSHRVSPLLLPTDSSDAEHVAYAAQLGARYIVTLLPAAGLDVRRLVDTSSSAASDEPVRDGVGIYLATSGSTGMPAIVFRPMSSWDREAARYCALLSLGAPHRVLIAAPLCHAYSMGWLWATVRADCGLEVLRPTQLAAIIAALGDGCTHCALTPFIASLLARRSGKGQRPKALQVVMAGAGPVDEALEAKFLAAFGVGLSRNYGSTESGALFAGLAPVAPWSIGRPMPGITVVSACEDGAPFELHVRLEDGQIFHTGDLAQRDHDNYLLLGRKTAAIRRGEHWVSPFEIESTLRRHPAVSDCWVRGVKSGNEGNDHIVASVVLDEGRLWDEMALRQFCGQYLAPGKIPDRIEQARVIERNATGKVLPSKVYRLAPAEQLIAAANAYKRSHLLFALLEARVLECLDGQLSVDQVALRSGAHADALSNALQIARLNGLVEEVTADSRAPHASRADPLEIVRLENHVSTRWNSVSMLLPILRRGSQARPFGADAPPQDFVSLYQKAMNGQHKQASIQRAVRKLRQLQPGPLRLLDVSATTAAYSRFCARKRILDVACSRFALVGALNGSVDEWVEGLDELVEMPLAQLGADRREFDAVVLDNAIHHVEVVRHLTELADRVRGLIIVDEIFLDGPTRSSVGLDWLSHGELNYPTSGSFSPLMKSLGFSPLEVLKAESAEVTQSVTFFSRH